jgi:uncharacterized membrane protein
MSDDNVKMEIVAAVYPDLFEAQATLSDLVKLHKSGAIELIDAAVMVRERSGNLTITERAELTPAKGARRGALIGAVIGIVFPPSLLASAALGAAAGAVTGKVTDQGFENELLEDIAQNLEPGKSAIIAVVEHTMYEQMLEAVDGYERILNRAAQADEAGRIEI